MPDQDQQQRDQELQEQDRGTPPAGLDDLIAWLQASKDGYGAGRVVVHDSIRYRVRIEPRPVGAFDTATGTITCPSCGMTSDDGVIELWEDDVARHGLGRVEGATATFHPDWDRFDDDGTDTRLGCSHCGNPADLPPGLSYDWADDQADAS